MGRCLLGKLLDENGVSPTRGRRQDIQIISITMLLTKQIITTGVDLTIITDTQDFGEICIC